MKTNLATTSKNVCQNKTLYYLISTGRPDAALSTRSSSTMSYERCTQLAQKSRTRRTSLRSSNGVGADEVEPADGAVLMELANVALDGKRDGSHRDTEDINRIW